jgi:2-methylcitrate dehydratase PrpD
MSQALTAQLGEFVAGLRYEDVPADTIELICTGFADCVGVTFVGALEPAPRLLRETLSPSPGEATLLVGGGRASAMDAAWINGTAAHALDYDDVALRGHPSVVLVPTILAEAEAIGATGKQMIAAYAAGYEVWAELVWRDPDHHHRKGWHPTAIFGTIAGAAACASLRGLDAKQCAHAMGVGASQSGGLVANFGAMAKPFQVGRASHAAVLSARLAARGYTAAPDVLEHRSGFMHAVSLADRFDIERPIKAGKDWRLRVDRLSIKKYPSCFAAHCAIDGMMDLVTAHKIDPAEVVSITAQVNHRHAMVLRNHQPKSALEAKFSMEFAMACPIIAGRVGLEQLTDEFVNRPDVQAMMQKVNVAAQDEDLARPGFSVDDRVIIELRNGQRLDSGRVMQIRGGPQLPLAREELWAKFDDCARVGEVTLPARPLFDALMSLPDVKSVKELPGFGG